MIWFFWVASWFMQLHFLTKSAWLGVAWPLFVIITLFISPKLGKYKLSWSLLLLGILADKSSHLAPGITLVSYLFLILVIWFLPIVNKYLNKFNHTQFLQIVSSIILVDIFYIVQSTSWNVLLTILKHEIIIISLMSGCIILVIRMLKNIFWSDNAQV